MAKNPERKENKPEKQEYHSNPLSTSAVSATSNRESDNPDMTLLTSRKALNVPMLLLGP